MRSDKQRDIFRKKNNFEVRNNFLNWYGEFLLFKSNFNEHKLNLPTQEVAW